MKHFLSFIFLSALLISIKTYSQSSLSTNKEVLSLIEKKREYNKKYNANFKIQLYYGNEKKAASYRNRFVSEFPEIYCKLGYSNPYWNVKVGNYRTRLEAERSLNKIRKKFSGATIVKH